MNKTAIGLAAALLLSTASAAVAVDVKAGAQVDAGAAVTTDAAGAATDATATGSVNANANYGQLISGLNSNQEIDLSAFNASSTVNCVTVSSLQGNSDNGASLDSAISKGESKKAALQGNIQSNTALWSKIQASCTNVADLALENILWVETDANGMFTIYVDDRTASGGASGSTGTNAGANSSSGG